MGYMVRYSELGGWTVNSKTVQYIEIVVIRASSRQESSYKELDCIPDLTYPFSVDTTIEYLHFTVGRLIRLSHR